MRLDKQGMVGFKMGSNTFGKFLEIFSQGLQVLVCINACGHSRTRKGEGRD